MNQIVQLSPQSTAYIVIILAVALMLLTPVFECIPRLGKCISRRWLIVSVFACCLVACVLDCAHLSDSIKMTVVGAAAAIALVYMCSRLLEKRWASGKTIDLPDLEVKKGDLEVKLSDNETHKSDVPSENPDDQK